jgi:hypothetical protein
MSKSNQFVFSPTFEFTYGRGMPSSCERPIFTSAAIWCLPIFAQVLSLEDKTFTDFHRKLDKPLAKMQWKQANNGEQWRTTTIWAAFKPLKSPPRHIGGAHFLATNWCNDLYWFVTFCDESTKIHTFHRLFTDAIATRERVWSTRRDCDVFWRRQENTQTTRH